eukprot:3167597-Pleurochrysis_carterae.AAC.1
MIAFGMFCPKTRGRHLGVHAKKAFPRVEATSVASTRCQRCHAFARVVCLLVAPAAATAVERVSGRTRLTRWRRG